jgi:CRISPR-associated exonuclease Cas4
MKMPPSEASLSGDQLVHNPEIKVTGSQINYYFVCKRKLWLFSHNIELEPESDLVKLGRLLHENRYKRKMKEVEIDRIKVDFIESKKALREEEAADEKSDSGEVEMVTQQLVRGERIRGEVSPDKSGHNISLESTVEQGERHEQNEIVIHEVKRSKKLQDAHFYQLLYYMYHLKKNYGVNILRGVLHYPLLKQNVDVPLTQDKIVQVEEALRGIAGINMLPSPPEPIRKGYCRNCAYQELCFG